MRLGIRAKSSHTPASTACAGSREGTTRPRPGPNDRRSTENPLPLPLPMRNDRRDPGNPGPFRPISGREHLPGAPRVRYDCLVISDLHLGSDVCQAALLREFLEWAVENTRELVIN